MASTDQMLERLTNVYVDFVRVARASGFRPLPRGDALVDRAYFASISWCARVFSVPVHRPGDGNVHAFHVANARARVDLFEHRLTVESIPVQVYEGSSFFVILVPADAFEASDPLDKAAQAAKLLLAVQSPLSFHPVGADPTGRIASTDSDRTLFANPGHPIKRLSAWEQRIDVVPSNDEFALVIYKLTFDDSMTIKSNPGDWFKELRKTWAP